MARGTKAPDEFAAAMQQLSAEAKHLAPPDEAEQPQRLREAGELAREFRALDTRVQSVETALSKQIEQLAAIIPLSEPFRSRSFTISFFFLTTSAGSPSNCEPR